MDDHRDTKAPRLDAAEKDAGSVAPRNRRQSAATLPDMGKISLPQSVYLPPLLGSPVRITQTRAPFNFNSGAKLYCNLILYSREVYLIL